MKKKGSKIKGFIFLILILALFGTAFYIYSGLSLFKPRDLGISYTSADYSRALEKTGMEIIVDGVTVSGQVQIALAEGRTGDTFTAFVLAAIANPGPDKKMIKDYSFEFSDFERKTFILTNQEATAFLNGLAPSFFWFDNIQVKALQNGKVEASSTVDTKKLMTELYSDVADKIPIPLPDRVNIYGITSMSVTNNELSWYPDSFYLGPVPLPERYMDDSTIKAVEPYLQRLYTIVPGFEIISLTTQGNGFFVDAVFPQRVVVTKR
ncbi:MAG: hypothetical protein Q8S24_03550 [Eubacteriales bacterium]|nr:hypothetical protein [Eubacteriales bacterium]